MTIASCSSVLSEDKTTETIREQSLAILRAGLVASGEADFWPAMHAAEGSRWPAIAARSARRSRRGWQPRPTPDGAAAWPAN